MKSLIPTAAAAFFVLCFSLVAQDKEAEKRKKPAFDWKETEAADFAAKLEKASAAGEKWTRSPESIILEWVGPFVSKEGEKAAATRNIRIFTKGEELPQVHRRENIPFVSNSAHGVARLARAGILT